MRNSVGLLPIGDLYLVLPAMNLSSLEGGILIICAKIEDVFLKHSEQPHVHPLADHLKFVGLTSRGDHSKTFLIFERLNPSFMHKSEEVVVGGGLQDFRVFGQGLRIL